MSVEIHEAAQDQYVEVTLSGKLTKEDYGRSLPAIEAAIDRHGKIRLLVVMHDFHGWTAGALWEDLKFDWKHFSHIERLAMVGEKRWESGMATFCRPFTRATIQYFDIARIDEERQWLTAESAAAVGT